MRDIQFDIEEMNNDLSHIEAENQIIKQMLNKTFASLDELDAQWEGLAKEAAKAKFLKDKTLMNDVSEEIDSLINAMKESLKDYKETDYEVKELVQNL